MCIRDSSMGGFIVPYTVPSAAFWKLGQAKPGDQLKFKEVSLEKAQEMRTEQTLTCSEKSVLSTSQINNEEMNKTKIKIDKIKIIYRGVDLDLFNPTNINPARIIAQSKLLNLNDNLPVIIMAARPAMWKGYLSLIKALSKVNQTS